MTNYNTIPLDAANTRAVLYGYIENGLPMPDLLMHAVRNDLFRAMTSVDSKKIDFLHTVVLWLYTNAPAEAIGNSANVRLWMERGGREGIKAEAERAKAHLITAPRPYSRHIPTIHEPMD
jgi:hypothetical protein